MKKLYLIDGFGGSPEINWLADIEKHFVNYFDIKIVEYTDATVADVKQWDSDLDNGINTPENAYFICHSLGCITLLRYLLRHNINIAGAVLVSGFAEKIADFPPFDSYFHDIELNKVKSLLGSSYMIASRTDEIVSWETTSRLAEELEIPLVLLPNGGHFTSSEGIIEMPSVKSIVSVNWL
ncbi:hypothetical protein CEQ21_02345 [Niallia circulans]|uniref:Serine hydrolase family protein n=1 Tax=Niallia circulans TaxID=1397 RepID=A0A553SS51_NIACI|nr:alpha/beta hydrolase [Niallia circulans]TRZ39806.1 hypothetical protein CEQ21_02345 [Niallia circulans]